MRACFVTYSVYFFATDIAYNEMKRNNGRNLIFWHMASGQTAISNYYMFCIYIYIQRKIYNYK